jgi:outer membrane protein OmpU
MPALFAALWGDCGNGAPVAGSRNAVARVTVAVAAGLGAKDRIPNVDSAAMGLTLEEMRNNMKKLLLATSILAGTAGFAAAEVTLSGNARMGVIDGFTTDLIFTSRVRADISMSSETDGGLKFGGSFGVHDAVGAASGLNGSVYVEGSFGKISMGDVDGAALAAVGHVSGVGLINEGDLNESTFIGNSGTGSDMLYQYTAGDLSFYLSLANPTGATDPMAVGVKYAMGDYTFALGYEDNDLGTDHIIAGANATFGAVTVKARYGQASGVIDGNQYALSVDYTANALTGTVFYNNKTDIGSTEAYGLGVSYDLGGGAAVKSGYIHNASTGLDSYDFGLAFTF